MSKATWKEINTLVKIKAKSEMSKMLREAVNGFIKGRSKDKMCERTWKVINLAVKLASFNYFFRDLCTFSLSKLQISDGFRKEVHRLAELSSKCNVGDGIRENMINWKVKFISKGDLSESDGEFHWTN